MTLVELVVAFTIMMILATMAVPLARSKVGVNASAICATPCGNCGPP